MMRAAKLLFSVFILSFLSSCFEEEQFPETPLIEFESLKYVDTEGLDSLVLSFSFQDGDADLGLNDDVNDLLAPYQVYSVVIDAQDSVVFIDDGALQLPLYHAPVFIATLDNGQIARVFFTEEKVLFSQTDNRPPFDCENYEIIDSDTAYVVRNEFYHNFHIQFMQKRNGNYSEIDFAEIFQSDDCELGNFNGRIPFYDPNGREGIITYSMLSQLFRLSFLDDTIQLRFWVYDRSLNKSNVAESPDFVLRDLISQ